MSYTRKYRETVFKNVTVEYDNPYAVQNSDGSISQGAVHFNIPGYGSFNAYPGHSGSQTVTVDIPVDVNIHVDTDPFEQSVVTCNGTIQTLTGAVVATETAQIASIDTNAKKVAGTIVKGFFNLIRSELSQQTVELTKKIEAHVLHLRELTKACKEKEKQMEADYNRISGRYMKIFNDLNNELENRIFELNKPAFVFNNNSDRHAERLTNNDMVNTVAVFGREGGELQGQISVSIAKKRAMDTIYRANRFLLKQKKTASTISQSMINENRAAMKYFPVCFIETKNDSSQISRMIYQPDGMPKAKSNIMAELFQHRTPSATKDSISNIQHYFYSEVNKAYSANTPHDNRVKEMIVRIFDANLKNNYF